MSVAHLSDVDAWCASAQRPTIAQQHVWGPVRTRIAALAGSAQSVCIAPHLPQMSVAASGRGRRTLLTRSPSVLAGASFSTTCTLCAAAAGSAVTADRVVTEDWVVMGGEVR